FQAEDGIRDRTVTGVQTCALPIFLPTYLLKRMASRSSSEKAFSTVIAPTSSAATSATSPRALDALLAAALIPLWYEKIITKRARSEERRVGKECRGQGWPAD